MKHTKINRLVTNLIFSTRCAILMCYRAFSLLIKQYTFSKKHTLVIGVNFSINNIYYGLLIYIVEIPN